MPARAGAAPFEEVVGEEFDMGAHPGGGGAVHSAVTGAGGAAAISKAKGNTAKRLKIIGLISAV